MATPASSIRYDDRNSVTGYFDRFSATGGRSKHTFKSYRLVGEYEKPWLKEKANKSTRWNDLVVGVFIVLGLAGAAAIAWTQAYPYKQPDMCLIYDEDFKSDSWKDVWSHEIQLRYDNGEFDWTTDDDRNSFVDGDGLHIVPTLTNETTSITEDQMWANYTLNIFDKNGGDGTCTSPRNSSCFLRSNPEEGVMIPPVRSARLTTKGKKSIRYGQVEVVAKIPVGDWLWPAIWMMPEDSVYGEWPRSGEIDIMESRGNDRDYYLGRNVYAATTHWGPSYKTDAYWRSTETKHIRRGTYSDSYHTYGMQWTPDHIYFYVDSKIKQILFIGYDKNDPLYEAGEFAKMSENDTLLENPWVWSNSTTGNAPFDQSFYLIMNVAVGGTNGWFADNMADKPWMNDATNAQWTFWSAVEKWLPTWGEGNDKGLTVKSVKMWQLGKCGAKNEL